MATFEQRNLLLSLLHCHSIIAHEAAFIFYSKNKFIFAADWTWDTVATWFSNIGPFNRSLVNDIDMWQHQPSHAWQLPSGKRVRVLEFGWVALEPPFPRNRLLHRPAEATVQGIVDNINPAVETFFQLVGNERPRKLHITFCLKKSFIPGVEVHINGETPAEYWFSMDIPNVVEILRTLYTADGAEVMWRQQMLNDHFIEWRAEIEMRWDISDVEEYDWTRGNGRRRKTYRWVRFMMRSKGVPEPLLAENPSPHSDLEYYHVREDQQLIRFSLE